MKVPVELLTLLGLAANRITAGGWPLPHLAFESREAEGIIRGTHFVPSVWGAGQSGSFIFSPPSPRSLGRQGSVLSQWDGPGTPPSSDS